MGAAFFLNKRRMKTLLILVGKTTDKHFQAGISDYAERISHYMPFDIVTIPELRNTKSLSEDQQKREEGVLLLKQVPSSAELILLDERGKEPRGIELAELMRKKMAAGRDLVFAIGGPYGFSKEVYDRADGLLSLSRLTFSHQMIRPFFVEQLYRAFTILKNEPYHNS